MTTFGPASRNNIQEITYWAPGVLQDDGELGFAAPVILQGRWGQISQLVRTSRGVEVTSKSIVHLNAPVKEQGYLAQGDHHLVASPYSVVGAEEILAFQSSPDLRNMEQSRRAFV